jgi:hypothetical protein
MFDNDQRHVSRSVVKLDIDEQQRYMYIKKVIFGFKETAFCGNI